MNELQSQLRESGGARMYDASPVVTNQPTNREAVGRIVLDSARSFQESSAKAGAKHSGKNRRAVTYSTPLVSKSLGCHSSQVKEFNEMYRRHGITGARHFTNGDLEISDNNARNRVMQVRGVYDRNAGYHQWAGSASD